MKNLMKFLLVACMFTAGTVLSYTITLKNSTESRVEFVVKYHAQTGTSCRIDRIPVDPRRSEKIPSGGCWIRYVGAHIYEELEGGVSVKGVRSESTAEARPYRAKFGVAGDQTFVVMGPDFDGHERVYDVTRFVQ